MLDRTCWIPGQPRAESVLSAHGILFIPGTCCSVTWQLQKWAPETQGWTMPKELSQQSSGPELLSQFSSFHSICTHKGEGWWPIFWVQIGKNELFCSGKNSEPFLHSAYLGRTKKKHKMLQEELSAFLRFSSGTLTHRSSLHNFICLTPTIFDLLLNGIGSSLLIVEIIVLYCMTTSIEESCDVNDPVAVIQQGIGIFIFFYIVP